MQPHLNHEPLPSALLSPEYVPLSDPPDHFAEDHAGNDRLGSDIQGEVRDESDSDSKDLAAPRPPASVVRRIVGWSLAAVIGLAAVVSLTGGPATNDDREHTNWQRHIQPLAQHNQARLTAGQSTQVRQVHWGVGDYRDAIPVGKADIDTLTTRRVLAALRANDQAETLRALAAAQMIPQDESGVSESIPQLSSGMRAELLSGDAQFYHVFLFDSCAVDGDVVEILVDGVPFATVPITHRGATLSIPVGRGTSIALRGVRDGIGGITVACRTSQGEFFMSAMAVGETQLIAIVR